MKNTIRTTSLVFTLGLAGLFTSALLANAPVGAQDAKAPAAKAASGKAKVGTAAPAFTLNTTDGKAWSLADAKGKVVVLQWMNPECPVCRRVCEDSTVANTLKGVQAAFPDAVYVGINSSSSRPSSFEASKAYLANHKLEIPMLIDTDGAVSKTYGAKTTPHCFVIDASGVLVYAGAIDDSPSGGAKTNYIVAAVDALKAGKPVTPSETKPYGCGVKNK